MWTAYWTACQTLCSTNICLYKLIFISRISVDLGLLSNFLLFTLKHYTARIYTYITQFVVTPRFPLKKICFRERERLVAFGNIVSLMWNSALLSSGNVLRKKKNMYSACSVTICDLLQPCTGTLQHSWGISIETCSLIHLGTVLKANFHKFPWAVSRKTLPPATTRPGLLGVFFFLMDVGCVHQNVWRTDLRETDFPSQLYRLA